MTLLKRSPVVSQRPGRIHIGPHLSKPPQIAAAADSSKFDQAETRAINLTFSEDFTREHSTSHIHVASGGTAGCF